MARSRPDAATPPAAALTSIDGPALERAFRGGAAALIQQADALNAINVFPVPDGDTGANMSMTMRAAVDAIAPGDNSASTVAAAVTRGALMGARGNSGVILSQILAGFVSPEMLPTFDAVTLAAALGRGNEAARRVISNPKEGTILTGIAAAAEAGRAGAGNGANAEDVLAAAAIAAADAAARTPDMLPVLKEAGVVDAGAQGLAVMLDGMLRGLRGQGAAKIADFGAIDEGWLAATRRMHGDGEASGFCTEFVVASEDAALDPDALRRHLRESGDSVLVVGGGDLLRVHVHTQAPDDVLAHARTLGAVSHEKVEDMEAQFQALARRGIGAARETVALAVVAVGAGAGIEALFASLGAAVVRGGQTMNPSAGEIREAIVATAAADVIVLPNNKNVILAAQQAAASMGADGATTNVHVVESRSIPQGVAALVAMNPEARAEENVASMDTAITAVRTGEITLAARPARIAGGDVAAGQPIGLVDGDLVVAEASVADAVYACVARMTQDRPGALITLYRGEGEDDASAETIAARLREASGAEVEVVDGGQPHYPYLIGVE